jgi:hypothetical protein
MTQIEELASGVNAASVPVLRNAVELELWTRCPLHKHRWERTGTPQAWPATQSRVSLISCLV